MKKMIATFALCASLIAVTAQAQAATWTTDMSPATVLTSLPTPQGAEVLTISDQSLINGVPAAMATFSSTSSVESVFDFYRTTWPPDEEEGDPGSVESAYSGWRMISRLDDGYNIVVQLHDGQSAAEGFISVMALGQSVQPRDTGPFSSLEKLSRHQSTDGKDTSIMSVYASPQSVSETHLLYRDRLLEQGWLLMADTKAQSSQVMVFSRDQSRLEVSVVESRDYGSMVVVNEVRSQ